MGRRRKRAELVVHEKETSVSGLIREVVIWKVPKSIRYPEGLRYRLILVAPENSKTLLLMDNHWPKGHHFHRGKTEVPYTFKNLRALIKDFKNWGDEEEKAYEG